MPCLLAIDLLCRSAIAVRSDAVESLRMPRLARSPFVRDTSVPSSAEVEAAAGKGGRATATMIPTRAAAVSPDRALPPLNGGARYRTQVLTQVRRSHVRKR